MPDLSRIGDLDPSQLTNFLVVILPGKTPDEPGTIQLIKQSALESTCQEERERLEACFSETFDEREHTDVDTAYRVMLHQYYNGLQKFHGIKPAKRPQKKRKRLQ